MRGLAADPRHAGAGELRGHMNVYRIRVARYRIVYEIDDASRTVTIARVGAREMVYLDL